MPGGDFEGSLAGWTLSGGAERVAGSEPYGATGSVGSYSLELPAGASAQSPFTCVNAAYPTFRFFARNDRAALDGARAGRLPRRRSETIALPLGAVALSGPVGADAADAHRLGRHRRAVGRHRTGGAALHCADGPSRIDDVFVDPRMR